ncbi:hypothetical protein PVAND_001305 [Polypedilum vanderplanki]|uniref:SET domain-containing protein n=1 Tax=Polypedilum vanderplanki TaxID=319348 RepID=A0A9J6BNV2_POLVA|nr:hypothetical protein PVAND_001305 [Polypedilum vanderplanki]
MLLLGECDYALEFFKYLDVSKIKPQNLKFFKRIKSNAEKVKFVENLLLEAKAMPKLNVLISKKSDQLAREYRTMGNTHFKKCEFFEALECYNKSLCCSRKNSIDMGLAYGNRSAVYKELKLYHIAIENINKAKNSNYPKEKLSKLEERAKASIKCIEEDNLIYLDQPIVPDFLKITQATNPNHLTIAGCLKLKHDDVYGQCVITDKDLKTGEIVAIEKPFSKCLLFSHAYKRCSNCLCQNFMNLEPCDHCSSAMFCSQKCCNEAHENFHKFECGINDGWSLIFTEILQTANRTFFEALKLVDYDISKLMEMQGNFEKSSVSIFDVDNKKENLLWAVNSLNTNIERCNDEELFDLCSIVAVMTHLFLNFTKLKQILTTNDYKDFYRNFIMKHSLINQANWIGLSYDDVDRVKIENYANGTLPLTSLINHSCAPNIITQTFNDETFLIVNSPIAAGEQLLRSYMPSINHYESNRNERTSNFLPFKFICVCEACKKNYPNFDKLKHMDNFQDYCNFVGNDVLLFRMRYHEYAKKKFPAYCDKIDEFSKHIPCFEVTNSQFLFRQCLQIFTMTPFDMMILRAKNQEELLNRFGKEIEFRMVDINTNQTTHAFPFADF